MGVWQCLCFAILLLSDLDGASVKLVHTGTERFEKDGVKHERSRYRLVPDHENNEPLDKAIRSLPNDEHNTNLAADGHAKKVAIKVLPNDGYKRGLKTDERTNKVALTILPNDAQDHLTYYSTKTQPKSGATHKTTYHYSAKTQPEVTEWSSGRKVNSSAKNLWNKDSSKDLYSYATRRHGDDQDHKLSDNKKINKLLFSKEFLELLNTLDLSKSGQKYSTAEKKLQLRLLIKTYLEKFYRSNSKDHYEITEDHVQREGGHDDLQWKLTMKALLGQLQSKMHSLNPPQELENRGLADNEIIQQNLYSLNTQREHENHGIDHEKLRQKLDSLNTQAGHQNHEHDHETLRQNRYSLNAQGEHKIHGNDQEKLQQDRRTLHTHENKNDHLANQEEKHLGLVPKLNLTKHLLVNGASRPTTLELEHIARLENETPEHIDTYRDIIESNVQTGILPNHTSKHTETEHKPLQVTVIDSETPIQFNHSHLLRYLISSVGLNKTFVMPGESGRYKLVHEGDEEAAMNLALIHWLKSQKKHIPSIDKRIMVDGDGHFEDELKVLPLHHAETKHKKHTINAQTVPDINTHIPVGIYHHDVNEILPEMTTGLDSIIESIIHIDKELGTITPTTEKNDVSAELKMVVDASRATATDNTLITTDDTLSSTDNTLTTSGNAHVTTENESYSLTSATENLEVSTTEDIDKSKLLNDPSLLELLSSYGLDMNDIVYEPEINMAIPSLTDQPVTIVDHTTTEEKAANNHHGLDITSTPEGHDVSTTKAIDIAKLENKPPLLELLSSNGLNMHDIIDEPEKHFAISSLNAHDDTVQNRTTTEAIETDYDGGGETSMTVNHEVSTTEVINISKFANDPSLLELLSSYGLDMHDVFDEPEIQKAYPSLAVQLDEATANSDDIDRSSTNENPEVSTTEVIDISKLENDPSLLELLTSYGLKMDDIVGKPEEEHIAITSRTAPPDTIVDRTTTKATGANNDGVDISKTTDNHEMLTTKAIDIPNLKNNSSLLDLPTSYGLEMHDIIDYTDKYMAMPSLTDDTIRELLETKATKTKEAKKDRVDFTSAPDTNKESTTEDIDMSKELNDPSLLDLLASYGLEIHDKVDEPDVTTASPLLTAHGYIIDRKATETNTSKAVVSTEKYATVIPHQDLDDIINYYTHAAEHLPETDDYENTSGGGKPLVVLDEIKKDIGDSDDLKNNLLALLEHETELANILELEQDIATDDPLNEYENVLTEPIDNRTSSLPGSYMDDDDDLKYRMDNLEHEQNYHKNFENVYANDLVNTQEIIQEPDQPKDLNQTWPQSWHANGIPRSSRIIYREEIRHSGNYNSPNINVHNNLNLVKQSNNAHLNAVAPDDFSHDARTYRNKDANHDENSQDTKNYANEHYLEIILGYLNSDILTNELNALMAYSGPGQDRDEIILQFIVGYLNKLGLNHHISQEQLQFLTHEVLKHLLNYNKQYKVRKIELIYEFDHPPHDLSSNVNMLSKNVRDQFRSYPHNVRIQEHAPYILPDDHLVPNFYRELQQNDIDIRDHNLHNLVLHPNMGDVSDQTHLLWYNQTPDLDTLSHPNAHPHIDENSNQEYKVSVSGNHNSPSLHQFINQDLHDIAPHQKQDAQNSDNIPKGNSVFIEQRNLFPDSDQEGLNRNEHNSNEYNSNDDYNNSDDSDHLNLASGDFIHHQQSDQLAPNDNVHQNEPNLNSDPRLFHSENSNLAPEQDHNHQNDNLAPNLHADLNEKELNLEHNDFNDGHTDHDHLNLLPEHYGYHHSNDNLGPNHNIDQNEHNFNSDYHLFDSEYSNLASGHQQQNHHLVPNQIADLEKHKLDFRHNHSNNNHDADSDSFVPKLDSNHHHLNNHHVDSEHLNFVPDHHGHHQQKNHLAPNYNVDNNEHTLGLDYQNTDDHIADPDHSNLAPGKDHSHKNDNLAPNQNTYMNKHELDLHNNSNNKHYVASDNLVPNIDSDHNHPDSRDVDSDHQNTDNHLSEPDHWNSAVAQDGYHKQNDNLYPNHNINLYEHHVNSDHHNPGHHQFDSDHSNFAPGQDHHHQIYHLPPNHNANLNEHSFDSDHDNSHHLDITDNTNLAGGQYYNHQNNHLVPYQNGGLNEHKIIHSNNHVVNSDHLSVVPEHHDHHQQNDDLAPNHNGDNNEHILDLYNQNLDDYLTDPYHSNLALGHDSYHKQNIHLAPNHNPIFYAQNLNFGNHNPYQHLVDSELLNSVPGHHQQYYYDLAKNHGSHSNQPNVDSNQYHSNTHWGAQPEQDLVPNPNVYSSPNQQIWPLETEQPNLVYEPHIPTFDHQQNEHFFPSLPHHQIDPWSSKENDNLPHEDSVDQLSLYYTLPYQQFDYIESSIYPQPDNFGQWTGSDHHNQPNLYPFHSYQQNEWYSSHQALSPEQQTHGLAPPNIDLSSSHQPYQLSYSDQRDYVDQRNNLPITNQHNGYEALGILDGTHLMEYLTDGIDLPNHGVVSSLDTKVHSLVIYLLDHNVSESIVLEFVDDVKKQLAEEFLEQLRKCQNKAYSILVQSISNLAQVYLQKHR